MTTTRRLLGLLLAVLLSVTVLSMPSGAGAASPSPAPAAAKVDPQQDFARMPRKCVDPKLLIPQKPTKCNLNGFQQGRPTIVLWGDSHAWQMIPALRKAARNRDVNLVAFVMGSCPVMDPALTPSQRHGADPVPACLISNDRALRFVQGLKAHNKRVHVLLGTYWQRYLRAIRTGEGSSYVKEMAGYWKTGGPRLFRTLGKMRVKVDVDGQIVTVPPTESCPDGNFPYACDLPRKKALRGEKSTKTWVKRQMRSLSGKPRYVDANRMCTAKKCYATVGKAYTFWDIQHISATMSRKLSYVLDQTVTRAGGRGQANGGGPLLDGDEDGGGGGGGGCIPILTCRA